MSFDYNQLRDLEVENITEWPYPAKVVLVVFIALLVMSVGYIVVISDVLDEFQTAQMKESKLKSEFKEKYNLAASLPAYRAQLINIEKQLTTVLQMLPSKNEMPELLDSLTLAATNAGLKINNLGLEDAIQHDFYTEIAISMTATGNYHQLGDLVSRVAKLPRIVNLHDFTVKKTELNNLTIEIKAKTYRFKDDFEKVTVVKHSKIKRTLYPSNLKLPLCGWCSFDPIT